MALYECLSDYTAFYYINNNYTYHYYESSSSSSYAHLRLTAKIPQDLMGKPIPEWQNILDFNVARERGGASDANASKAPIIYRRQIYGQNTDSFLQAGRPSSAEPTNSVEVLKARSSITMIVIINNVVISYVYGGQADESVHRLSVRPRQVSLSRRRSRRLHNDRRTPPSPTQDGLPFVHSRYTRFISSFLLSIFRFEL